MNDIILHCNKLLNECPFSMDVKNYLDARISKECQDRFLFGYFPNNDQINLLSLFFEDDYLLSLKLIFLNRHLKISFFNNHPLIMPYRNVYGETVAIVGRTILSEDERDLLKISKYKNTIFDKSNHLFGLFDAKESIQQTNCVYVVEGQFDVIKAYENGLTNVVATGNANLSENQLLLLLRYTDNIVILFDNDEAGNKGRNNVRAYKKYANISDLFLPKQYKDLCDFFQHKTLEEFKSL